MAPKRRPELSLAASAAQEAGPSQDEVSTVHTLLQRAFETQQAENSYWHDQILGGYQSRSYQTVRILAPQMENAFASLPIMDPTRIRCGMLQHA